MLEAVLTLAARCKMSHRSLKELVAGQGLDNEANGAGSWKLAL